MHIPGAAYVYRAGVVLICLSIFFHMPSSAVMAQDAHQTTTIPAPAAAADEGTYAIENILLLGSDTENPRNSGRTDVIVIVSLNLTEGTVALLSVPRDLYVYIPNHGMQRINTAFAFGEQTEAGTGPRLLSETILYNLGIRIDHYARVDFNGFRQLIDDLGGIEVTVDCAIQDWRLRESGLDPQEAENWELFTLPVGVHLLDGDLALWYARSRRTSSDFDRGRRHQVILRSMLRRIRELGLLGQIRDVWPQVGELVRTDLNLDDLLRLTAAAGYLRMEQIASYTFRRDVEARSWRAPDGASVQVPISDSVAALVNRFLTPPTRLQVGREHPRVEIVNASGVRDLARVAADRLEWEGFSVDIQPSISFQRETTIIDFTAQAKGSSLALLQDILRVDTENISISPDPARIVDFRVILGSAYRSCTYEVMPPITIDNDNGD